MVRRSITRKDFLKLTAATSGAVLAGGSLTACGGDSSAAKPKSLNILYATAEANSDSVELVLPDFKKEFGIDIKLDTNPYDALQQKVFAELASSSPFYDLICVDTPWMPALTGKLEPLVSYFNDQKLNNVAKTDVEDFIPKVFYDTSVYNPDKSYLLFPGDTERVDLSAIEDEGFEVFGFPLQANVLVMSYRKDLFDDPQEQKVFQDRYGGQLAVPKTWDEFVEVAEFFTRPDERLYGTTLMAGAGDWATDDFKTLLECWGGDGRMVTDDFQMAFDSPEGVAALSYYRDLIQQNKVVPPGTTEASWDTVASTFGQGLTAMGMNYHNMTLEGGGGGEVSYAMVPQKEKYGPHFGTWMLSVNKFSENKEWAYRTATWLTSSETQTKMLEAQLHPTRTSVYEYATSDSSLRKDFGNFYEVLGNSLAVGVGRPRLTNYSDVTKTIGVAVNNAASGRQSPEAVLGDAAGKITDALKQAGYNVG
jgi:multiple sugar transport system substrate-binding protein